MSVVAWISSGLLAIMYLLAGGMKVALPRPRLEAQFAYSKVVGVPLTRAIGVVELLGAVGVILPRLLGIVPILSPLAAVGLALVQLGAIGYHLWHKDPVRGLVTNVVLLALSVFVAVILFLGW